MPFSSPNPRFDNLLESSHRDDSNKWSSIGFSEEIKQEESIEAHFRHRIWNSRFVSTSLNVLECLSATIDSDYFHNILAANWTAIPPVDQHGSAVIARDHVVTRSNDTVP